MSQQTSGPVREPKYIGIAREISRMISEGMGPHQALPVERELQQKFGVSRSTVRAAISVLVDQGRLYSVRGSGTYVGDPHTIRKELRLTSFTEDMAERGHQPGSQDIQMDRGLASDIEGAEQLDLPDGAEVLILRRVRLADGEPMAVETALVPAEFWDEDGVSGMDGPGEAGVPDGAGSLDGQLERKGHRPVRARQSISAVNLDARDAWALHQAVGAAALRVNRVAEDCGGRVVQVAETLYRADRYGFDVVVEREGLELV